MECFVECDSIVDGLCVDNCATDRTRPEFTINELLPCIDYCIEPNNDIDLDAVECVGECDSIVDGLCVDNCAIDRTRPEFTNTDSLPYIDYCIADKDPGLVVWKKFTQGSEGDLIWVTAENNKLIVRLRERVGSTPHCFAITDRCVRGMCDCCHKVGGVPAQMKPCRMFVELFLRGEVDADWYFILSGIVFGFGVINENCSIEYTAKWKKIRSQSDREIIEGKLLAEIEQGMLSIVPDKPKCTHNIFCVPKEGVAVGQ